MSGTDFLGRFCDVVIYDVVGRAGLGRSALVGVGGDCRASAIIWRVRLVS